MTECFSPGGGSIAGAGGGSTAGGAGYPRRSSLQLWQFLVALLDDPANTNFICWTGRGLEFKLIEPEEVRKANHSTVLYMYYWYNSYTV
jgi:hypothetical protein